MNGDIGAIRIELGFDGSAIHAAPTQRKPALPIFPKLDTADRKILPMTSANIVASAFASCDKIVS
jgi:hypothetical protein